MNTDRGHASKDEAFISVDIEAAGPVPGEYSLLSLGACLVGAPETNFYVEFRPMNDRFVPEAMEVHGLSLARLRITGHEPAEAMARLRDWVLRVAPGQQPVFVGFNAPFDWSFVNWYFHVYLGENPFGFEALDIKSYFMGLAGCTWAKTDAGQLPPALQSTPRRAHHALDDVSAQAEMFTKLLAVERRNGIVS